MCVSPTKCEIVCIPFFFGFVKRLFYTFLAGDHTALYSFLDFSAVTPVKRTRFLVVSDFQDNLERADDFPRFPKMIFRITSKGQMIFRDSRK